MQRSEPGIWHQLFPQAFDKLCGARDCEAKEKATEKQSRLYDAKKLKKKKKSLELGREEGTIADTPGSQLGLLEGDILHAEANQRWTKPFNDAIQSQINSISD